MKSIPVTEEDLSDSGHLSVPLFHGPRTVASARLLFLGRLSTLSTKKTLCGIVSDLRSPWEYFSTYFPLLLLQKLSFIRFFLNVSLINFPQ